jgi:SpoVK/Ycf46/Vps4 family AAA+-type ATPase
MARADLLKRLFRGYQVGDRDTFMEAAREIVEDERKKSHDILANELLRILDGSRPIPAYGIPRGFDALPKDSDRGTSLLEVRQPQRFLKDLVLTTDQRNSLRTVIDEFRRWEILEANGLVPSHKILFCGPPGCGKTATAEAMATELGLPLLYVRFDSVVSSLLGETAANLRKLFDYSSRGSWVILFDEFDAIGRSRDDASEHGELKRVVNSFLQLLDHFIGKSVVIAATNFEQALDPALWRRFDEIIRFERPTLSQIEDLLGAKLKGLHAPRSSLTPFAKRLEGMSHAEIERVCLDVMRTSVLAGARGPSEALLEEAVTRQERRRQALARSKPVGRPSVDSGV